MTRPVDSYRRYSLRHEALRSFELHREVILELRRNPDRVIAIGLANIDGVATHVSGPSGSLWVERWAEALTSGPEAIEELAMLDSEEGDDLRQVTPFAGVLSQAQRRSVLQRTPRQSCLRCPDDESSPSRSRAGS